MSRARKYTLSLQHVFAGERLQAFSDAVFSIIVTFMVGSVKPSQLTNSRVLLAHVVLDNQVVPLKLNVEEATKKV